MIAKRNAANISEGQGGINPGLGAKINVAKNGKWLIPQIVAAIPVLCRSLLLDRRRAGGCGRMKGDEARGDSDGRKCPPGVTFVYPMSAKAMKS